MPPSLDTLARRLTARARGCVRAVREADARALEDEARRYDAAAAESSARAGRAARDRLYCTARAHAGAADDLATQAHMLRQAARDLRGRR